MPPRKKSSASGVILSSLKASPPPSPVKRYLLLVVLVVMAISASYLLVSGVGRTPEEQKAPAPSAAAPEEASTVPMTEAEVIKRVKRYVEVQGDETPKAWVITNTDLAKDLVKDVSPDLFANAGLGDYVLLWSDRAVVYSPSKDKIVGMVLASNGVSASSTPSEVSEFAEGERTPETLNVEIRNGSGVAGAARRLKADLAEDGFIITKIGDAKVRREGSLVVDLTGGSAPTAITMLLEATSGTAATVIPEGEPSTASDILVIIGR